MGSHRVGHDWSDLAVAVAVAKGKLVTSWLDGFGKREPGYVASYLSNLTACVSYLLAETIWNFKANTQMQLLVILICQEMNNLGKC